jgi:outer membrane protein
MVLSWIKEQESLPGSFIFQQEMPFKGLTTQRGDMFALNNNTKQYRFLGWTILLAMVGMMSVVAEAAAGDVKIGFVDIQKAITETKEFKKSQMKFRVELQKEKGIIEARKKKVEGMLIEINKQANVLNPTLKKKKEESFLREKKDFERYVQDREEEFASREKIALDQISKKMLEVLKQLGKQKKLTMVLEKKSVFYSDSTLDLTELSTKTYNKLYP